MISVVTASISRSSAVRSAKPGRACFAWSFSKATTKTKAEREKNVVMRMMSFESAKFQERTFNLGSAQDFLYLFR